MENILKENKLTKTITTSLNAISQNIESLNDTHIHTPIFNEDLSKQLKKIQRIGTETGKRIALSLKMTPETLLILAKHGWYLEYAAEFSFVAKLRELVEKNNSNGIDKELLSHYRERIPEIIDVLANRHPKRKEIFEQINSIHNQGLYYASVTSILPQVDGICFDLTKKMFFLKDKKNQYLPKVVKEISTISKAMKSLFLLPLINEAPITARESSRHNYPSNLNRHVILHGIDIEYGTEINSYKCISLLKYLSDVLQFHITESNELNIKELRPPKRMDNIIDPPGHRTGSDR